MKSNLIKKISLFSILLSFWIAPTFAEEAQIAVAANFAGPMQKIVTAFEKQSGHKATIIIGSTGKFYAQITNGAPFDVLLAADDETPAKLEKENQAVAGSRFTYAIGKLVLWSANPNLVDDQGIVLKKGDFKHLALANPKVAPYGLAATETLKALGLEQSIQSKIVLGENIAQTHQFIATANAELGFLAYSQVIKDGKLASGSVWVVPEKLYSEIRQDAVLLNKGKANKAALAFLEYLKASKAREIIRSYGYKL